MLANIIVFDNPAEREDVLQVIDIYIYCISSRIISLTSELGSRIFKLLYTLIVGKGMNEENDIVKGSLSQDSWIFFVKKPLSVSHSRLQTYFSSHNTSHL